MTHIRTTTAIIGAGQSGIAMSHALGERGIDHVLIEQGRAGQSWRSRRWDSLRLLTPNAMNSLAGMPYQGRDPEGFMKASEFATDFDAWIAKFAPPLIEGVRVQSLTTGPHGYAVQTDDKRIEAASVVVATGQCARSKRPPFAKDIPGDIAQLSPLDYKSPEALPEGGVLVVGAAASGLQIARELRRNGRRVVLAVGNHSRLPRRYRGKDIVTWMSLAGLFDEPITDPADLERLRRLPSLPLVGDPDKSDIDLNTLQAIGIEIAGRFAAYRDGTALFSGSLSNVCASADLKMNRLLDRIDALIDDQGLANIEAPHRLAPTRVPEAPCLSLDLKEAGIGTILWATGFEPDHSFIDLPVFDRKGRIQHDGGVVGHGLYVMGLTHMRTSRSTHIDGAPGDAAALADHFVSTLAQKRAA